MAEQEPIEVEEVTAKEEPVSDDLDALLSEYKEANPPDDRANGSAPNDEIGANVSNDLDEADTNDGLGDLQSAVGELLGERDQARENADAERAYGLAREAVEDMVWLPDDYAQRWLQAEYWTNPELANAWDNRYASEAAADHAERLVGRALKSLRKSAKSIVDPQLTEDREAVSQAVRGASSAAPEAPPVDYSRLSDGEFRERVNKDFGFDVGV